MKNEILLKRLTEIYKLMDTDTITNIEWALKKNAGAVGTGMLPFEFAALIQDVQNEIRQDAAKASGKGEQRKALQRILKAAIGTNHEHLLQYPVVQDGKQYFCSGFHMAVLHEPMDWVSHPDNPEYPDMKRLIVKHTQPIELPDPAALKAYIKIQKARKNKRIIYSYGSLVFNAQFLLDILEALPGAVAYHDGNKYHGLYLEAESGTGLLLPCRPEPGDEIPTVLN